MRRLTSVAAALVAAVCSFTTAGGAALAAAPPPGLQITTDFPSITTEAGDTVTFDLEVLAPTPTPVTLEVSGVPDGWEATLRGGGFVIGGVTAAPESPPVAELELVVPPEAEPDTYAIGVRAAGGSDSTTLDLSVTVADRPVGGILLTTDFASLRGRPSDTFQYDLQITNQSPQEITFAFDGQGPEGWTVTAGPASEERASTVTVEAGGSESVRVEANPPANAAAGSYDLLVTANGGGLTGSFALTAEITGQPEIELTTATQRLDLSGGAGKVRESTLVVVNSGTAPLEEVALSADAPTDWTVEFEPAELPTVAAGASEQVTVRVEPAANAVAGDYAIGVTARSGSDTAEVAYRFTVETSRWWGAVGVAVIVAAFVVLFVVFRRYGRR